jgi:hypothetical protein
MKNHGVMVAGDTVAQAYRRLYMLERVCRGQLLAMATGRPLELLSEEVIAKVQGPHAEDRHSRVERERLFFEDDADPGSRITGLRRLRRQFPATVRSDLKRGRASRHRLRMTTLSSQETP